MVFRTTFYVFFIYKFFWPHCVVHRYISHGAYPFCLRNCNLKASCKNEEVKRNGGVMGHGNDL